MRERVQDLLLALFVTVMQVQGTVTRVAGEPAAVVRPLDALGYGLLALGGVVLVARRRRPVTVFVVTAGASLLYYGLDFPDGPGWLGLFVALYTLTALGDGRRSVLIAAAGITILAVGWLVAATGIEPRAAIGWVFFRIGASIMSAALGESVRSRRIIAVEALARAELAERTREHEARVRVDAERLRIAREVHDTVAHAIAIINVQSGVTAHVLDQRPEQAREALRVIEQTSSRALREMRTVLGVLHDDGASHRARNLHRDGGSGGDGDRELGFDPDRGSADLGELLAGARTAGLEIVVESAELPAAAGAVGDAVYRIVQESLSNVLRHAGPTRVTVAVEHSDHEVRVRVSDEGPGGRGIAGMRERCRLLGGELQAGPAPGGGFEVTARLPVGGTAMTSKGGSGT